MCVFLGDSATSERRPRDSAGDAADLQRARGDATWRSLALCRDLPDLPKEWIRAVRSLAVNASIRCGDANRVMWLRMATTRCDMNSRNLSHVTQDRDRAVFFWAIVTRAFEENVFPHFGGENVEFMSHCALSGTVSAAPAARLRPAARHSIMRPATQRVV